MILNILVTSLKATIFGASVPATIIAYFPLWEDGLNYRQSLFENNCNKMDC